MPKAPKGKRQRSSGKRERGLIVPNLTMDLLPFQSEDANRIMGWYEDGGKGFINVSQMGTGKTISALAVAENFDRVLVVSPSRLMREWRKEICSWTPHRTVGIALRDGAQRFRDLQSDPNRFVVNYESFRIPRHQSVLMEHPWDFVIFDEAHKMRNRNSQQTRGIVDFRRRRSDLPMLLMTGSPLVNSPDDLYPLLGIVDQHTYPLDKWFAFVNRYCLFNRTIIKGTNRIIVWGEKNTRELRSKTDPFVTRRLRKDVLPWLPEKSHRDVVIPMEKEQRRIYTQMLRGRIALSDSGQLVRAQDERSLILRLRQLSLDPRILGFRHIGSKTAMLRELVKDYCIKGGRKLVCFTTFAEYAHLLSKDFTSMGVSHALYTGRLDEDTCFRNKEQFQNDDDCMLFLGTVQSAGLGLTLTASSDVVHLDKWWTRDAMDQASDRCCRIGQKNAVQVISLINENSVDEIIEDVIGRKEVMADSFTDQGIVKTIRERLTHGNT